MGWQTYSVVDANAQQEMCGHTINLVENLPKQIEYSTLPKSSCLGVLGIPGITAYIALTHVCQAKEGENIVISSGAGQIGHLIGQIAKILKLNVIGTQLNFKKSMPLGIVSIIVKNALNKMQCILKLKKSINLHRIHWRRR